MTNLQLDQASRTAVYGKGYANSEEVRIGFIMGAQWHESLPLAERLTEEEKAKIKELHALYGYKMTHLSSSRQTYRMRQMGLEDVFGKDFFKTTEQ